MIEVSIRIKLSINKVLFGHFDKFYHLFQRIFIYLKCAIIDVAADDDDNSVVIVFVSE